MALWGCSKFEFLLHSTCLFGLALPLEAESPVDNKLAAEREDGGENGDAVNMSDHLLPPTLL